MRALYRVEVVGDALEVARRETAADESLPGEAREYGAHLVGLVETHGEEIDAAIRAALDRWDLGRLAVTDRCVLRMAAAELLFEFTVPKGVVLDEAIEIAKRYGTGESGRFVNGVLDRVAREHRGEDIT